MKHKLPAIALFLVIVVGVLVFSPVGRGSSVADLGTVAQSGPNIYAAEMDSYVCLSESEVHTTASLTTASADSEDRDFMPTVFLMMLDVGVCASLSPISSTTRILAQPGAEKSRDHGQERGSSRSKTRRLVRSELASITALYNATGPTTDTSGGKTFSGRLPVDDCQVEVEARMRRLRLG